MFEQTPVVDNENQMLNLANATAIPFVNNVGKNAESNYVTLLDGLDVSEI